MVRYAILDQSPVVAGRTAAQAIAETLDLVDHAERLGYHRYWFAEHHGSASFASASPAVLMAACTQRTSAIRLGSGGMLLGHAQPLAVAETVRALSVLAPGRIDAGFGRAPGGDGRVASALREAPQEAAERLRDVLAYLADGREASNDGRVVAVPNGVHGAVPWMLGTSESSARLAADLGLPYAFGAFIDPTRMDASLMTYHQHFAPSLWGRAPQCMVATVVFCGTTTAEAERKARSSEQWFVESFLRGRNVRFPAAGATLVASPHETMLTEFRRRTVVIGDAATCAERLTALARRYATDDIAIVTITDDHTDRVESYALLAEALGLEAVAATRSATGARR